MSSKLKNIKAIGEMLEGRHFTQTRKTIGFTDADSAAEKSKKREVGEIWEEYDEDGNVVCVWEQKQGYRVKSSRNAQVLREIRSYLNSYPNCLRDEKYCKSNPKNRLDLRFRNKFGRCAECQLKYESDLKIAGKYAEYEREQMLNNANSFFEQADKEIETVCSRLEGKIGFANQDGSSDDWVADPSMAKQIRKEYQEYKRIALNKLSREEE